MIRTLKGRENKVANKVIWDVIGAKPIILHSEGFRIDDYVVIISGTFKGYNGEIRTFQELDSEEKIDRLNMANVVTD